MTQDIMLTREGHVATISLNRPKKLNALTPEIYALLADILDEIEADDEIRIVVLRGEGRAFSAGFDLGRVREAKTNAERKAFIEKYANGNRWKIWNSKKVYVAQTHGYCLGGGLEIVFVCDFCITTEDCKFGEPEIKFGIGPTFISVPWSVGHVLSKAILLRGNQFTGADAARWGIATEAVPQDELQAATQRLIDDLLAIPPATLHMVKAAINRSYDMRGMRSYVDNWAETNLLLEPVQAKGA